MKGKFWHIIPKSFRSRSVGVAISIFLRAILNFAGIAALLPILYLILDSDTIHSNALLHNFYTSCGFESDYRFIVAVAVAMILFIILKNLLNILLYRYERDFTYALYRHLSQKLFIGYFNRGLQYIKSSNSAILSRNVNVVCYTFVTGVLRPLATIVSECLLLTMIFISIAIYSPVGALLAIAVFIPTAALYFAIMRYRLDRFGDRENEAHRHKYRDVIETYRGYADIEINNAFDHQLKSFNRELDTIVSIGRKNATISTLPQNLTEIGLAAGLALMLIVGSYMGSGEIKILFGIFAVAGLRLLPSIRNIMGAWSSLRYNHYTVEVLNEAENECGTEEEDNSDERIDFEDKIDIDNISFRFADAQSDTLHNLTLSIRKGEKLGINGESGAGKTTLLNILLGLYRPTAGEIRVDGITLDKSLLRRWQNSIGYVSQSIFLTDSTILQNIAFGCDDADIDMAQVEEAVKAASLSEFVSSLPKGINTRIGECGALLSGGQRQRIGIARALYKRADILFFDEATSSLDNATEQSINKAIEELSNSNKDLTIVVVAHRESSLDYCDRIITLEKQNS